MSVEQGVSGGEWAVFAEKVVKERDAARERVKALEDAIKASHATGAWGPVEDAYAAGGHPCLKHRAAEVTP